jgi:flagellar biosynthetic protein FliR
MTPQAEALLAAAGLSQGVAWAVFLVFLRVGAAMALLPAFGEQSVPLRIRLGLALAFTAVVAPAVAARPSGWPDPGLGPVLGEVAAGLILGLGLRLLVVALQVAGTIAAQSVSLTQLFGGIAGEPQPALANLFVIAALALAAASGLHVQAAALFLMSYDLLPPGTAPAPGDATGLGVAQIGRAFGLAFSLAAPFAIAALLYNVALGIINRALPALMVTFVGAPAITLGALALTALAAPAVLAVWQAALAAHFAGPFAP